MSTTFMRHDKMPPPGQTRPLSRTPSCHDLDFTLRRVFNKKAFRYAFMIF